MNNGRNYHFGFWRFCVEIRDLSELRPFSLPQQMNKQVYDLTTSVFRDFCAHGGPPNGLSPALMIAHSFCSASTMTASGLSGRIEA